VGPEGGFTPAEVAAAALAGAVVARLGATALRVELAAVAAASVALATA
jgi:16S rRNA U1498 N3-methylase RsmE